ncbi:MAG TPA: hypothetical protein VGM39_19820 [Kofleriaceae bacterium]|jgi:hypothetical protein
MIESLLLLGAVGSMFGWASTRNFRARLRARWELRAIPPLDDASPDGARVKVTGRVRALETLHAPLSGKACVAYRSVCGVGASGKHRQDGVEAIEERTALFALERGTDPSVIVDGSHAVIDFPVVPKRAFSSERTQQFLAENGVGLMRSAHATFKETIAEIDVSVVVAGTVMRDAPLEPTMAETHFRDSAPPTVRLAGNAEHPLLIVKR